jgi:hypothetical protein
LVIRNGGLKGSRELGVGSGEWGVSCYALNLFVLVEGEQGGREQRRGFDDFFPKLKIYSLNAQQLTTNN